MKSLNIFRGCLSSILIRLGFKIAPEFYLQQLLQEDYNPEELLFESIDRLNDILEGDDGQAWKEAERFISKVSKITGRSFKLGENYHVDINN